jgi:hypothetical protein
VPNSGFQFASVSKLSEWLAVPLCIRSATGSEFGLALGLKFFVIFLVSSAHMFRRCLEVDHDRFHSISIASYTVTLYRLN